MPFLQILILSCGSLLGSTLAGITGFGGAAVLLPLLVTYFGVKDAIPILTVAQLIGNGSRVYLHRHTLNLKVVIYFSIGAIPAAVLGGYLFASVPTSLLIRGIGLFLIFTVVWRHWRKEKRSGIPVAAFLPLGAIMSFLSALVGSVGPFMAPFFLSFGLTKSAFIGTEALSTVIMHLFKLVAYRQTHLLTTHSLEIGLSLGPIMIVGSWLGKQILHRISERTFLMAVEATLIVAGLNFLIRA
jgi:hypothetical protein